MQKKRNFVAQKSIGIKDMSQKEIHLKAVLFDMDGVLFNSMPYHAEAWHKVMQAHGLNLSREEAYLHEGRTGAGTINIVSQRQLGREAIVIENAPLGVQAGIAACIFTIAVNTGPLDNKVLLDAGANALYPSMQALCDGWTTFTNSLQGNKEADKKRK